MIQDKSPEEISEFLRTTFDKCGDFNFRTIRTCGKDIFLANIGNFSGRDYISENVIKPLVMHVQNSSDENIFLSAISASEMSEIGTAEECVDRVLAGAAVVFAETDGGTIAYSCMARNDPARSVDEPNNEIVVRGPREGFVENAENNVALLRKRLRTPQMKVLSLSSGKYSSTSVKVVYIEGVADEKLVKDICDRIDGIDLPSVIDSGYIEQFLPGEKPRLFTEVGNSEKPDKVAAKLSSGRIAIICDGSPVVLTVPYLFAESLQSTEDYLNTPYYATFIRIIRFASVLVSLYLPAFYIAIMEFHKNAVPHELYSRISKAREGVPLSLFGEIVVILLIFELIREVGVRMPGAVGNAVSIVCGLILGDAAVSAGISSEPVIMVAAITAITTFILPPFMNSAVLLRFVNLVAARLFGLVGIALSLALLIIRLCRKTSFGVPYMSPFAPVSTEGFSDTVFVNPGKALKNSEGELKR